MACIEARGLRKVYGNTVALDGIDLHVREGRILGLIGPNGAGKTTALNAILGLTSYEGILSVLGRDPWESREKLMRDVSFIADVAAEIVGPENMNREGPYVMASEDFSYMLEKVPGAFINIGNGGGEGGCEVHNPGYDFNDDIITLGATLWSRVVERKLVKDARFKDAQ